MGVRASSPETPDAPTVDVNTDVPTEIVTTSDPAETTSTTPDAVDASSETTTTTTSTTSPDAVDAEPPISSGLEPVVVISVAEFAIPSSALADIVVEMLENGENTPVDPTFVYDAIEDAVKQAALEEYDANDESDSDDEYSDEEITQSGGSDEDGNTLNATTPTPVDESATASTDAIAV